MNQDILLKRGGERASHCELIGGVRKIVNLSVYRKDSFYLRIFP